MSWRADVLVVANVTVESDALTQEMRARTERGPTHFTLLVPATGGGPEGRRVAHERLDSALAAMREAGFEVDGFVGDADPCAAVQEAWDPRKFDEVIVATLPTHLSRWLQVDLPHRVEKITGVPVPHVVAAEPRTEVAAGPPPPHEDHGVLSPLTPLMWGRGGADRGRFVG